MNSRTPIIPDQGRSRTHTTHAAIVSAAMDREQDTASPALSDDRPAYLIVKEAAQAADQWRIAHGMSDSEFTSKFSALCGDRKTFYQFARVPMDKWDRNPEKWADKYRRLPAALSEFDAMEPEPGILDLPHVLVFADALRDLRRQTGEKRALWVEGHRGSGKTVLLRKMRAVIGDERCVIIRGRESWSSCTIMMEDFLRALGDDIDAKRRGQSAARMMERVRGLLNERDDLVIGIDEAHMMRGPGINALRDWINDAQEKSNRIHFVGAALPSLWKSLTDRYKEESLQLVRRFSDRIELCAPDQAECLTLAAQRMNVEHLDGFADKAATLLARKALTAGGRSYVADVAAAAGKVGERLTWERFQEIAQAAAVKNHGK